MKESLRKTQQRQWGRKWKELARGKGKCVFISLTESGLPCGTQDPHWGLWAVCDVRDPGRMDSGSCGILVTWPEIELASLVLEGRFLTTGPPGKFPRGSIPRLVSENRKTTFCPLLCPTKWNSKGGKDSRWLSLKQKWIFCKVNETEASGPSIHRLLPEPLQ